MTTGADSHRIFDRAAVRRHRQRPAPEGHDFLTREIASRLGDRLGDFARAFPAVLEIGGSVGGVETGPGTFGADRRIRMDLSANRLSGQPGHCIVADEETLPFRDHSFDLVAGILTLHWVNDLPGALIQINRALKPDGLFLAAMLGGRTLTELRQALLHAEARVEGGASPRVSPFADVRDAGALLQRAGFAMPVADTEIITVTYADAFALMRDLRGMGETNAVHERRKSMTRRQTLTAAAEAYQDMYGDGSGRLPATFEIVWLTGWAPGPGQPKPLAPGSATASFAEALKRP